MAPKQAWAACLPPSLCGKQRLYVSGKPGPSACVTNAIKCLVRSLCLAGNNDADYKETFQHFTLFPRLILVGMTLIKLMHSISFDKIHTACGIMLSWLRLTLESPYPFVFPSFSKLFFFSICQLNCVRSLSRRLYTWNRKKKKNYFVKMLGSTECSYHYCGLYIYITILSQAQCNI